MNIQDINRTISELENDATTFSNCEKLAHLYIVREYQKRGLKTMVEPKSSTTVKRELSDILPYYEKYCNIKKEYQLYGTGKEAVLTSLQSVCREILDLIHTLYTSTDMPEERHIIVGILSNIPF